ncbi:MAG: phosphoribosyltransferase family protein, partial [Candidatus Halalkalibacterium sp. M3_1C_030]
MDNGGTVILMDEQRIKRSLKRIAHQVSEDNRGAKEPVILGINERGYAVAELLQQYLQELSDKEIQCRQLIVDKKESSQTELSLKNKYVLLVDDVIFSGTTMFDALNQI